LGGRFTESSFARWNGIESGREIGVSIVDDAGAVLYLKEISLRFSSSLPGFCGRSGLAWPKDEFVWNIKTFPIPSIICYGNAVSFANFGHKKHLMMYNLKQFRAISASFEG
jgi:hypothetical protein